MINKNTLIRKLLSRCDNYLTSHILSYNGKDKYRQQEEDQIQIN